MKELLRSIVIGVVIGTGIYLALILIGDSDAALFGIAVAISIASARMFSPSKSIKLGLYSLLLIDWVAAFTLASIMFIAAKAETFFIRAIESVCIGVFFLAVAISVRNPKSLFRKSNQI